MHCRNYAPTARHSQPRSGRVGSWLACWPIAALLAVGLVVAIAACGGGDTTRVLLNVSYQDGWGLTHLQLQVGDVFGRGEIAHTLEVRLPDTIGPEPLAMRIDGYRGDELFASGTVEVVPRPGEQVSADVVLRCGDACVAGETRCAGDAVARCERTPSDGCTRWATPVDCPTDRPYCSLGSCDATCTNECSEGSVRCNGPTAVQVCADVDSDPCTEWGAPKACDTGKVCNAGYCVDDCVDCGEPADAGPDASLGPDAGPGNCQSCAQLGKNCGLVNNNCGQVLNCGVCATPETCGGGGAANVCGTSCEPATCGADSCGTITDGCGGTLDCGGCDGTDSCGGGGEPNVCGCTPSCGSNAECGDDGCGGTCGSACAFDETCDDGLCCLPDYSKCNPYFGGCCPGACCLGGFCTVAGGC